MAILVHLSILIAYKFVAVVVVLFFLLCFIYSFYQVEGEDCTAVLNTLKETI